MSDSVDEESPWVLYKNRKEWKDVVPLPQNDGPDPVVAIAYSAKFSDCYDYFRAILKSGEKSERALTLTGDCLQLNPANYIVWVYRRKVLRALGKNLHDELKYINKIAKDMLKNYQVWHHRKVIVEWLNDPVYELEFTKKALEADAKNYHAWQYRQWCIKTFNLYDKELEYVEELIREDVRNNSAWNQRYFVISNTTSFEPNVIDREIDYALREIRLIKRNESAWNYLRGIAAKDSKGLGYNTKIRETCEQLYEDHNSVNHLLACIIDISNERRIDEEAPDSLFHITNAIKLCRDLEEEYDTVRRHYWNYVGRRLEERLKANSTNG